MVWTEGWWPTLAAIAAIALAVTAIVTAWRVWAWPGIVGLWHAQEDVVRYARAAHAILERELLSNEGQSIKDQVSLICTQQKQANVAIRAIELRLGVGLAEMTVAEKEAKP